MSSLPRITSRSKPRAASIALPQLLGFFLGMKANHIFLLAARVDGNQRPHTSDLLNFLFEENMSRDMKGSLPSIGILRPNLLAGRGLLSLETPIACAKCWAGEMALTLRLQTSSDSVQLFEDKDNATSNVFTEVFEGFIDESFTKTAKFVYRNLRLRRGVSQKPMYFKRIEQRASNDGIHRNSDQQRLDLGSPRTKVCFCDRGSTHGSYGDAEL
jgi:hypothetical protein